MARKSRRFEKWAKAKRQNEEMKDKHDHATAALDHVTAGLADHIKESDLRYRSLVISTQLPIVAGVVFQNFLRTGMARARSDTTFVEKRQKILLSRVAHYADFGMHSEREMELFASTVSHH